MVVNWHCPASNRRPMRFGGSTIGADTGRRQLSRQTVRASPHRHHMAADPFKPPEARLAPFRHCIHPQQTCRFVHNQAHSVPSAAEKPRQISKLSDLRRLSCSAFPHPCRRPGILAGATPTPRCRSLSRHSVMRPILATFDPKSPRKWFEISIAMLSHSPLSRQDQQEKQKA